MLHSSALILYRMIVKVKKLNLMAPINSLGYGVVGLNVLKALHRDVHISLFPLGNLQASSPEENLFLQQCVNNQASFDYDSPCLKVWHEFAMAERIGKGQLFGFPFFEITKFDPKRINSLLSTDHVIVASSWAQEIVESQLDRDIPVSVCPLGVDGAIFNGKDIDRKAPREKCVFLNCGKWETRKGHDILLQAFQAAFHEQESVELWMMAHNPFLNPKETDEWERYYRSDSRVSLVPRQPTHQAVAEVMRSSTCGVFPSRAEGWNLELLEMIAMNKPVIATNYSAHTEFCDDSNCLLVDVQDMEIADDGKWFKGDVGEWASLEGNTFDQLVEHMISVYQQWCQDPLIPNGGSAQTRELFSWKRCADRLKEIVYA